MVNPGDFRQEARSFLGGALAAGAPLLPRADLVSDLLGALRELAGVEGPVRTAASQQLLVRALLDDGALVQDEDRVGTPDGGEPVRDHEARPARAQPRH